MRKWAWAKKGAFGEWPGFGTKRGLDHTEMLSIFRGNGPMRTSDVASALGWSLKRTRTYLQAAHKDGMVTFTEEQGRDGRRSAYLWRV